MKIKKFIRDLFKVILITSIGSCDSDSRDNNPVDNGPTFQNPILLSAPDPWVVEKAGFYYVTYTTGNSLELVKTAQMSDVSAGEVRTIWTPPPSGPNSGNIWAPELHFIDDKWYFYYAADDGSNENHRMFVLENSSADPFQGSWVDKGEINLPGDAWAIDGTIAELDNELFFMWSGWEGNENVQQNIYVCRMADPWTADGDRVIISQPLHNWEKNGGPPYVNEAPQWLVNGDNIFVVYSASGCWTDDYSLGLLVCDEPSDILNPASWTKSTSPVFTKNASSLAFGPGHNSFFKSKNGTEDWLTYHANASAGQGCGDTRSTRMQKFTWQNNVPNFGEPVAVGLSLPVPAGEN